MLPQLYDNRLVVYILHRFSHIKVSEIWCLHLNKSVVFLRTFKINAWPSAKILGKKLQFSVVCYPRSRIVAEAAATPLPF